MVLRLIIRWLVVACALLVIAEIVPGIVISSVGAALFAALLWGFISLFIRPILKLVALPITLITLGLFSFVINALLFWLMAALVPGFQVHGFLPALIGSLLLSAVTALLHLLLKQE
jgi:putative membrane protein